MKYPGYLLFFVIILLAVACHKNGSPVIPAFKTNATLPGKWKVIGNMLSAGGPMYFVPSNSLAYVAFNIDGTLGGTAFSGYKYFTVKDTVTIHMTSADNTASEDYYYVIKYDTLKLSPAGPPFCIEGCALVLLKE